MIKTPNALLWPFWCRSNPQYHPVKLTQTEPQHRSAKRPTNNTRIRDEKWCFLPDSMFIWRDRESVFIQGQALVSVISRPCCGGNAYYVVVREPCLLWPWGLFPWRNGAQRNERSDHRNRPEWPEHHQTAHLLSHLQLEITQTLQQCHRVFSDIFYTMSQSVWLRPNLPLFLFFPARLNSVPLTLTRDHKIFVCFLFACYHQALQSQGRLRKLYHRYFRHTCTYVCTCMCTWSALLKQ